MALAIDASTPAAVHSAVNVTTATTASFTPPAGSQLWAFWAGDDDTGISQPGAPSITDNLGAHLTWNQTDWSRAADTSNTGNGQAAIWWANCPTSQAMTVTVTTGNTNPTSGNDAHLRVIVLTGADTAQNGAHGKGGGTTQTGTATYTATRAGSWGWLTFADWNASASHPTLQAGCTEDSWTTLTGQSTGWVVRRTTADGAAGSSVTVGATAPTVEGRYAYVEILPAPDVSAYPTQTGPGRISPSGSWTQSPFGPSTAGQTFTQSLAGTLTSSGAITRQTGKEFAGTGTSSGALTKQVNKSLAGTGTSAAVLAKLVGKPLAGTLVSAGTLAKQANKAFAGTITSSGTLTTVKVLLRTFTGTLTSSGASTRQANKALTGSVTPSGALGKLTSKALAAAVTAAGSLAKLVVKPFAGSATSSGTLTRQSIGATQNAISTATLTATDTSTSFATAQRTATQGISGQATSTPTVSDG